MKIRKETWMHMYPLLLFAMIVLSLLFLVCAGTEVYSAAVEGQAYNRQARAALSYLAARVHAAYPLARGPRATRWCCAKGPATMYTKRVFTFMRAPCGRNTARPICPCAPKAPSALRRWSVFFLARSGPVC